ncbi:UrcA family protein [Alteraurantiacibacter aquimixticola]|uniref:UrcA family protein n=1 Tax=Alteraurantiacibacter aquimixticola TaxID=2489173 RepID=A0A4T3EWG4_9SPHN|nr:UrcA family protein [Alteraurantiacibacter aquimixticola]TIX48895.1 UrcA family protein [Alteraurantiacibacter aquimixticola]
MRKTALTLLAAIATAGLAAPAAAAGDVTIEIDITGLDVNNEQDLAEIQARIERAARSACRRNSSASDVFGRARTICREELIALATEEVEELRQLELARAQEDTIAMR